MCILYIYFISYYAVGLSYQRSLDRPPQVSYLHDFSLWVLGERLGVKRYSGRYTF